jgi:hypothetical protein
VKVSPRGEVKNGPLKSIKKRETAASWDRCYDFYKYFRRKIQRKNWRFLIQNKAKLCKILIITLVFEKNANFFVRRKLSKIAENCDHNIDLLILKFLKPEPERLAGRGLGRSSGPTRS